MRIHNAIGQLVSAFTVWDGFLKDPNYVRVNQEITWSAPQAIFMPDRVTRQQTLDLSARRQFSFRVSQDDSLIQICYRFNDQGEMKEARLAYYEVGESSVEDLDQFSTVPIENDDQDQPVRWLRIDYSATLPHGVLHSPCHLHLSGHPNMRFAVRGVPSPSQFVELVVAMFYPSWYTVFRLDEAGKFADEDNIDRQNAANTATGGEPIEILRRIPHILTPGFQ